MTFSFTQKTIALAIALFAVVVLLAPAALHVDHNGGFSLTTAKVYALGGSGGGSGGSGGSSGGSCCSVGGGGTSSGGGYTPPPPPPPATCNYLNVSAAQVTAGQTVTLSWSTSNATNVTLNGIAVSGTSKTVTINSNVSYTLTASNASGGSSCSAAVSVSTPPPAPTCDNFTASKTVLPYGGGDVNLSWNTSNADSVSIDNGVGSVPVDGSKTVHVSKTTTYILTASANSCQPVTCPVTITVKPPQPKAPTCDNFTASPSVLPYGGGSVNLVWNTSNADSVSIDHGIGTVSADGSKSVNVTNSTTYTLTATKAGFAPVTCPAPVKVNPPSSTFSCENNVQFTANKTSFPVGGGDLTLNWSTTGADSVSITGISNTSLSGSATIPVHSSQTYTLTATKGTQTIHCPLPVTVAQQPPSNPPGGGGGGGVVWPYCQLTSSAKQVQPGDSVQLTWKTQRATDIRLFDNHGNVIFDTPDTSKFNGSLTVKPTQSTKYTLIAHRGSIDLPCVVNISMPNTVTILQSRDQKPLMAGIALTQVPYTGFDAGPFLTFIFYALLTLWGLFVAYVFVIRRKRFAGISLPGVHTHVPYHDASVDADPVTNDSYAEEYVQSATADAPHNLPTATPVVGYAAAAAATEAVADTTDFAVAPMDPVEADASIAMTELENRAHAQKALLSSDAMRYFMSSITTADQADTLDVVVRTAKETFPSEDGWVVLNLARMESLLAAMRPATPATPVKQAHTPTETTPITGGSLAEAMVSGNIVAAYEMIASRPMIALADAAADLDAVYRARKGATVSVSDFLQQHTVNLTDEQLHEAIAALTGALDGTYTNEAEAVKMAILKAVKALA